MKEPVITFIVTCKECDGRGRKFDHFKGVFTIGMGYLIGRDKCGHCNGQGYRKVDTKRLK